jgi:hypothetical protein
VVFLVEENDALDDAGESGGGRCGHGTNRGERFFGQEANGVCGGAGIAEKRSIRFAQEDAE